jgi:hypothetical protein
MPIDYSKFSKTEEPVYTPPVSTTPPVTPPRTFTPPVNPDAIDYDALGGGMGLRDYGALGLRTIGGLAPGGFIGAGVNAATEFGAQSLEDKPYNLASIGGAAAIGAIPFSGAGKLLATAGKSGLLNAASTGLRQQTEEGLHMPSVAEGRQIALSGGLGLVGGAVAAKIASKIDYSKFSKAEVKAVDKAIEEATGTKVPVKAAEAVAEIKTPEKVAEVVAEIPVKIPKEVKLGETGYGDWIRYKKAQEKLGNKVGSEASEIPDKVMPSPTLPKNLSGAASKYNKVQPVFENDIDKALFVIGGKGKSANHDKYVKWLTTHTGLEEKELKLAAKEARGKLGIYLKGMPKEGEVKVPKFHNLKFARPRTAAGTGVDIVTGKPIGAMLEDSLAARTAAEGAEVPTLKSPTVEPPPTVDPVAPQVDLQTATVPKVEMPEAPVVEAPTTPEFVPHQPISFKDYWKQLKANPITGPLRKVAAEARQLQTGLDLSFPFRQGITNVTRQEFWNAFRPMVKAMRKEGNYEAVQKEILSDPDFDLMQKAGMEFTEIGKNINKTEEALSKDTLVEKFNVFGFSPIRASNRAYMAFGNKLRKDLFKTMINDARKANVELIDAKGNVTDNAKAIARYINDTTGRGHLGRFEKSAAELNDIMFSPKLMASRVNMFRRAFQDPNMIKGGVDSALASQLRKRAIRDMIGVGGLAATAAGISASMGEKGTLDPTSTDFGKFKFGNLRLDPTGGFQQYVRVAAQLASGKSNYFGSNDDRNRKTTAERFGRNKLSPMAGLIVDWMAEKNVLGEKFTWTQAAKDRVIPLIIQDLTEIYQEDPKMLPAMIPAALGVGIQSYKDPVKPSGGSSSGSGMFKMGNSDMFKIPKVKIR